jgi:hypothetical protein
LRSTMSTGMCQLCRRCCRYSRPARGSSDASQAPGGNVCNRQGLRVCFHTTCPTPCLLLATPAHTPPPLRPARASSSPLAGCLTGSATTTTTSSVPPPPPCRQRARRHNKCSGPTRVHVHAFQGSHAATGPSRREYSRRNLGR